MLKIKVSIPGFSDNLNISQFVGNNDNIAFDCKFYVNDPSLKEADHWFVIEDLQRQDETVLVNRDCVFFLSAEVVHPRGYYDSTRLNLFLEQFNAIFTCNDIYRDNSFYVLPFLPWMINSNHGPSTFGKSDRDVEWLRKNNKIEKTKMISVICSNQNLTADHRLRLKFVNAIKDHFGDTLDWYGNGINPLKEKWDGIAPYKYHIVLENQSRNNIITEKLFDSFLGLSYPIYYGAPNVKEYFNANSLTQIDIFDLRNSIKKIEILLEGNESDIRIKEILESRNKVLFDYNLFKRIADIALKKDIAQESGRKQIICLHSVNSILHKSLVEKLAGRASMLLRRITNI
jgi:hypothetical protein